MRSYRYTLAVAFSILCQGFAIAENQEPKRDSQARLLKERSFREYAVRIYGTGDGITDQRVEISMNGSNVFERTGFSFAIGDDPQGARTNRLTEMGRNITGDGTPDLIISEWTGGCHCCFLLHVFEIGATFRHVQTIDAGHSDLVRFEDVDNDGALELPLCDWTFAYWHTCFAESPAPQVILKFGKGQFRPAAGLMQKPPLSKNELAALKHAVAKSWAEDKERKGPPPRLWGEMLKLIYSGRMKQAWELFEMSWPEKQDGKQAFREAFDAQLKTSPYWTDIQKMNKGQ